MKFLGSVLFFIAGCFSVSAGQVAIGNIDEVVNLIGSDKQFAIKMSLEAVGPCRGNWVEFKEANFNGNIESYKFAFSLATAALMSGKKIRVHNYSGDTCDGVTFIGVFK